MNSFVSLFSGCGGFDLGFIQGGFHCDAAYDVDPDAVATHRLNLKSSAKIMDLSNATLRRPSSKRPAVVVAGPPCQGFSTAGRRDPTDPRNAMLAHAAFLAVKLDPEVVVIENVAGAVAGAQKEHWNLSVARLKDAGYRVAELKCNAIDFGVPQVRKRLIILAWKNSYAGEIRLPTTPSRTLGEAIQGTEGLPNHLPRRLKDTSYPGRIARHISQDQKLSNVRSSPRAVHTWCIPEVFGRTNKRERAVLEGLLRRRRQQRLRSFGDADPVTASALARYIGKPVLSHLKALTHKGYVRQVDGSYDLAHTFNGKFRRLPFNLPAPTVDTKFGDPYYFLHPTEHRAFTVREAARLQGFPDSFEFNCRERTQFTLVGNAVPPPIGKALALFIRSNLLTR